MTASTSPDGERYPQVKVWKASGEFIRAAYTLRKDDDDWGQANTLVRKVMDDVQGDRLVSNVVGHLKKGVSEAVLQGGKGGEGTLFPELNYCLVALLIALQIADVETPRRRAASAKGMPKSTTN